MYGTNIKIIVSKPDIGSWHVTSRIVASCHYYDSS